MNTLLIVDLTAKSLAILLAAFALQALWRRASAAQRCLVWLGAFVCLLVLPLTLLMEPQWTLRRPAPPTVSALAVDAARPATVSYVSSILAPPPAPALSRPTLFQAGMGLWLAGAVFLLVHRLIGTWRLRKLRAQSDPCGCEYILGKVVELAKALGLRRPVEVRTSGTLAVPVTWGSLKPVLLLPADSHEWDSERLSAALLHELGHIHHHDATTRLLATVACALHWPNPLVWLATRSWRAAQEQAADDLVLRFGIGAQNYALQLLQAARSIQHTSPMRAPVLAMARPATLETRLTAIMDAGRNRRQVKRHVFCVAAFGIFVFVTALGSLRLQAQSSTPLAGVPLLDPVQVDDGTRLIAIEIKTIETPAGRMPEAVQAAAGKVLSSAEMNTLLRPLLANPEVKISSFPRLVTKHLHEATIRSVVHVPQPAGQPPVPVGKVFKILPVAHEGSVDLNVDFSVTEQEAGAKDFPRISSRALALTVKVADAHTAVLGFADGAPDGDVPPGQELICLVTPHRVDTTTQSAAALQERLKEWQKQTQEFSRVGEVMKSHLARRKASSIILPRVHFTGATLDEAIEFLRVKNRQLGADGGIDIAVAAPGPTAKLNLDLTKVSLDEALWHVADLSGLELQYSGNAAILNRPGRNSIRAGLQPGGETAPVAAKARAIVPAKMNFRTAEMVTVVSFIRDSTRGQGINIVLDESGPAARKTLTFSSQDISLLDLLHRVAVLADCTLTAEGNILTLKPVQP